MVTERSLDTCNKQALDRVILGLEEWIFGDLQGGLPQFGGGGKAWKYISLSIRGFPRFLATLKMWCYSDVFFYLASSCTSCRPCFKVRDQLLPSVAPRAVETIETQDDKEWYAFQPCKSQEILYTRLSVYDIETYWDKNFPCWSKVSIVSSLEWEQTSTLWLCHASIAFLPYSGDVTNAKFPSLLCQQKKQQWKTGRETQAFTQCGPEHRLVSWFLGFLFLFGNDCLAKLAWSINECNLWCGQT